MDALEKLIVELMQNADERKLLLDRLWELEEINGKLRQRLLAILKKQKSKP